MYQIRSSEAVPDERQAAALPHRDRPFPDWIQTHVDFELDNSTYIEIRSGEQLYELVSKYIAERVDHSFRIAKKKNVSAATRVLEKLARLAASAKAAKTGDEKEESEEDEETKHQTNLLLGLGIHRFQYEEHTMYGFHQTIGEPATAGWGCNPPKFFHSLILFVQGTGNVKIIKKLCDEIITASESKKDKLFFNIYRWNAQNSYWQHSGKKIARDVETIILPEGTMEKLEKDMERFLDPESVKWYFQHGIPYKRSYLFFGVPGSGKSSLIQAFAARFDRNLCFLQPTHPMMTDDAFKACIQSAPANSMIVLEDIDALFNKDRSKKHEQCPLTFSGLLNGLDGVGNPDGQIFVLTTNFVDKLDEALIRSGRVDLHIKFPKGTPSQLKRMFLLFYPEEEKLSETFVKLVLDNFQDGISMAAVQQHFISNMFKPAQEVVDGVKDLGNRLDVVSKLNEKTKLKEEKEEEKKEEKNDEESKEEKIISKEKLKNALKDVPGLTDPVLDSILKQFDSLPAMKKKEPESEALEAKDAAEDGNGKAIRSTEV